MRAARARGALTGGPGPVYDNLILGSGIRIPGSDDRE